MVSAKPCSKVVRIKMQEKCSPPYGSCVHQRTLSMVEFEIKLVEPQFSRTAVVLLKFDAHTLDEITFRTLDLRVVFLLFLSTNYVTLT